MSLSFWPGAILPDLEVKVEPEDGKPSNVDGQMIKLEPELQPIHVPPDDLNSVGSLYEDSPVINEPSTPIDSEPVVKEEVEGDLKQPDAEHSVSKTSAPTASSYIHLNLKSAKFRCTLCGKEAESWSHIQMHIRAVHLFLLSQRKRCTKCGRWVGKALIRSHNCSQLNLKNKNCQCQICGKTFRYPDKVRAHHRKVHLKGFVGCSSVECKICGKVLCNNSTYRSHFLAAHSQNSDIQSQKKVKHVSFKYPCKVVGCKKGYRSRNGLNYHMEKVHGEKKKEPDVPNPGISEQNNQQRKFKCMAAFCNKEFPSSFSLSLHQKSAHRKLGVGQSQSSTSASYECDKCRFRFRSLSNLEGHRKECR